MRSIRKIFSCNRTEDVLMDENIRKRNECLAQTVIRGLQSRNMSGYYAANKEEAKKQALELIPEGSTDRHGWLYERT